MSLKISKSFFFLTYLIFESKYTILSTMLVYFFYYRFLIGLFLSNRTRGKNIEIFTQSFSIIFNNSMHLFNYSYLLFLLFRYQIFKYHYTLYIYPKLILISPTRN